MAVINKNPDFMAMPLGFKRGNPIALDTTAVWYSYEETSTYAASSPIAYVGQILSLVDEASNAATAYMIMDAAGTLQEVGKATLGDNKTITLEDDVLSLKNWGVQYYKWVEGEGDNPGQHVLQVVNEENPWIAGLEPKTSLEEGQIVIAWYQPSSITVESVNSALSSVQSTVNNITGVLGTKDDVAGTDTVFGQLAGKVDTTGATMTGALILADGHEAISDNAVDTKIANAIGSAGHLKRLVVDALPEASAADADTIYMIKDSSITLGDAYKEYMLIDGAMVQIGDTSVDLEPYATKVMLTTHENNSVLCTAQTLTEAQQAQARENVGAASAERVEAVEDALPGKLSEPAEGLAVGKYFRVAAIDENGHAVLEAVDAPKEGLALTPTGWPEWTADEQAAARERMGIPGDYELIEEITLEEDVSGITISREPDGTSLNLKKFIVMISDFPEGSWNSSYLRIDAWSKESANLVLKYLKESTMQNKYVFFAYEAISPKLYRVDAGVQPINSNIFVKGNSDISSRNYGASLINDTNIIRINVSRSGNTDTLPAGTNIKLYGVRA